MCECPEVHRAKETKAGGWTRHVDCPCDLKQGHDEAHRCGKHGVTFAVIRASKELTAALDREEALNPEPSGAKPAS